MTGKKWKYFKLVSMLLVLSAFVCAVAGEKADSVSMWTKLGIISCVSVAYIALFFSAHRNLHSFVSDMETQLDITERDSLYKFPSPAAVIDSDGVIVWYNKAFREKISSEEIFGTSILNIADIDLSLLDSPEEKTVEYITGKYRISAVCTEKTDSNDGAVISHLSLLCFEDISEYLRITEEYRRSHLWVMYVMIDSYEDIFINMKDSEKSHVIVETDKIIVNFVNENRGLAVKVTSDKYLTVIGEETLQKLIDNQFRQLLDKVRAVMDDEKTPLTISIGVGHAGKTIADSEQLAKQALDMTQSRGGDQAAIKDGDEEFAFFGGNSKGVEKHAKVRTRVFSTNLLQLAAPAEIIFIMGHKFSDFDSVGAAAGMCGALRLMDKKAYVCVDTVRTLSSALIERLRDNLSDGDDIFISPEDALVMCSDKTLLIIVDTCNKTLLESYDLYEAVGDNVVYIDHHRQVAENAIDNAVVALHEPYASSACELVCEVIQYMALPGTVSSYYAEAMLAGIMLDTKEFVNRTGVRTFEAAAYLKRLGADTVAVKRLFAISLDSCHKRSRLIESAEIHCRCAIAVWDTPDPEVRLFSAQAADELLGTAEVDASFVLFPVTADDSEFVKISARSFGTLNVQLIMESLGGGGHQTMASADMKGVSIAQAKAELTAAIDKYLEGIGLSAAKSE